MPEAPEVQTVLSTLEAQIKDVSIEDVLIYYPKIIDNVEVETFKNQLIGQTFHSFNRLGKYLIFGLDDYDLVVHLRMEGKFYLYNMLCENKHIHIVFKLNSGTYMSYHDTRKFGRMNLVKKIDIDKVGAIKKQGIEANSEKLTKEYLYEKIHKKNIPIKSLLLDQTIISGLGNIYANEVMFDARINPSRLGKDISLNECDLIVKASKKIIDAAIKDGGTTIKSYTSSLGVTGRFQQHLMVHKREGEECKVCGTIIENIKIGGRSTYFCPKCQK